jgi:hypothetical protein
MSLIQSLDEQLARARFADPNRNPILERVRMNQSTANSLRWALVQYCHLPAVITELLCRGVVKLRDWPNVRDELLRNLGEELGTRSGGRTHYAILKDGLLQEAGVHAESDPAAVPTQTFINDLRAQISDRSAHEAVGALFALEDSAVPELRIVARLINALSIAKGHLALIDERQLDVAPAQSKEQPWTLQRFLAAHISDFEVGHRDLLSATLSTHLAGSHDEALVCQGFAQTLTLMETWWEALALPDRDAP